MIYILSITICLFCSIYYDLLGRSRGKRKTYRFLLCWFIVVSGFQYMMGTDIAYYMLEYQSLNVKMLSWNNIIDYHTRYQPGWMIICYLCRFLSKDFLLLKFIQALFLNIAVFKFIKGNAKYIFTAILLYAITDYLVLNFNVMRQSFAVGFGLYAITELKASNWKKFALYTLLAYMFHNSALLLLALPLVKILKPNKHSITILMLVFSGAIIAISRMDLTALLQEILFSDYIDEGVAEIGRGYMTGSRLGVQDNFSIFSLTRLIYFIVVAYYLIRYNEPFWGAFGLLYLLILILSAFLPILWRYRLYVDIPFFIMFSQVIMDLAKLRNFAKNTRCVVACSLLFFTLYISTKDMFYKGKNEPYAAIHQYYPYHSIFNPKVNIDQLNYFESLSN